MATGLIFLVTIGMTLSDDDGGSLNHIFFFSLVPTDPKAAICPSSTVLVSVRTELIFLLVAGRVLCFGLG